MRAKKVVRNTALIAALALGLSACTRGGAPEAREAVAKTKRYMDALREKDVNALSRQSEYPFVFKEPAEGASCKPTAASDAKQLPAALACVLGDTLLAPMLASAKELVVEPASAEILAALSLPARGPEGTLPVIAYVPGNGVTYHFIALVGTEGVRGLWKQAAFGPD
jgi:D-alanine-D-alanine ligase-like ATP-grasp enzyme